MSKYNEERKVYSSLEDYLKEPENRKRYQRELAQLVNDNVSNWDDLKKIAWNVLSGNNYKALKRARGSKRKTFPPKEKQH